MSTFLKKVVYFIFPIVMLFIGIELYFRNQNHPFKLKATHQKENLAEIENVFLGSSHTQNGINPEYFSKRTSNLGFAAQNIQLDSALFFKVIPKMEKVKNVIIELDYHRLDDPIDKNYFRLPWYYIYYDIEVYPINLINKISLYSSNIQFFNSNLLNSFKSTYKEKVVNKYGYVVKNYNDYFAPMKYDSLKIFKTASTRLKNRHTDISLNLRLSNKNRINQMVTYCNQNNIKVYILTFPLCKTYRALKIVEKDSYRKHFIDSLVKHSKVKLLDYESSTDFNLKDFSDDDHLNPSGAKKLSLMLNKII